MSIRRWINARWPLDAVIRWSLVEEMPEGASYEDLCIRKGSQKADLW